MNPEVRSRWTAALRSGRYAQGDGKLSRRESSAAGRLRLCCLGVLCELAVEAGVVRRVVRFDTASYVSVDHPGDLSTNFLPESVQRWAGLRSGNPVVGERTLVNWNDERRASFARIADLIEEYL